MGSNENFQGMNGIIRPSNVQGGRRPGGVGNNNNRRVLSAIDKNIIGAPPHHCAVNKKGPLKRENENENATCNKNPVAPIHRPVTRRFAAQLAAKQSTQEAQPTVQLVSTSHHHHDDDLPMYAHHTESMLEEIDRMDAEVEMEVMDEDEAIVDIDSCDRNNPLAVSEYINDLYTYYRKTECVPPNYMAHQFDINERMRGILIDWLIEVHYKFELMEETLYLTVNIIDRFLAVHSVVRKKLQLVGVTSLLLACKYEEVSVPVVEDLILITDRAYCRKEVLDMEKLIVNTLQFNMSLPTPYVFMRRFLKAAQSDKKMELVSFYIIELCLVEYEMLHFPPSLLAAAAVFTAQCALTGCMQWSKTSEKHTGYTQDELLECAKLMVSFHEKAGSGKLTGVYKKYSTSKYGYAAKVGAASSVFLINDK